MATQLPRANDGSDCVSHGKRHMNLLKKESANQAAMKKAFLQYDNIHYFTYSR
jgi:hypothetical protein